MYPVTINSKNLYPVSFLEKSATNDSKFSEVEKKAISFVKDLSNENIVKLTRDINNDINNGNIEDWGINIIKYLDIEKNGQDVLSEKAVVEIIKILIKQQPTSIVEIIEYSGINNHEAMFEIAKTMAENNPRVFLRFIDNFGIESQKELAEIYKLWVIKGATHVMNAVMKALPPFKTVDSSSLIDILECASTYRPDLVLKFITQKRMQDQKALSDTIIKCITQVPYVVSVSKPIQNWVNEHREVLSSLTDINSKAIGKAVHISPNKKMIQIFSLFKKFAEEPATELVGRNLWVQYSINQKSGIDNSKVSENLRNPVASRLEASLAQCGMTALALKCAIFGVKDMQLNSVTLQKESFGINQLNEVWTKIKENQKEFKDKPSSYFISYIISCSSLDHQFIVVQHCDKEKKVKYRILQSWVKQHNLNDYMTNRDIDLSSEEFNQFTNGLNEILFQSVETYQKEIFYQQYFMSNFMPVSSQKIIEVEWGPSDFKTILHQKNEFDHFKENHIFMAVK
jgi:hypothetical protein